jgi:MFS family permease
MVWCDLLSAVSIFIILMALLFSTWKVVFFATLVSAILSQFSQPSAMKLFKVHIPGEQMQAGMSLYQTMMAAFMILGPLLGTFAFQHLGINISMVLVGIAFLFSALVLTLLPTDQIEKKGGSHETSLWHEMKLGFQYVWSRKALVILGGGFMAAGLGIGFIHPLGIFVVTERLGLAKEYLQWLFAANGAAMIIGGGVVMLFSNRVKPHILLLLGMGVNAVGVFVIGWSTMLWLTLLAEFMIGLAMPGLQIGINTIILKNTDEAFIGRVNGILTPLFMGSMVITMSIGGLLKQQFSLFTIFQISAALFVLGIIVMLPMFRNAGKSNDELVTNVSSE